MFVWNSLAFSIIQWMLAIWSLVVLPFLNLAWLFKSSPLQTPGSHWLYYCLHSFAYSRISYNQEETVYSLFRLTFSKECENTFSICLSFYLFLFLSNIPFCECSFIKWNGSSSILFLNSFSLYRCTMVC